MSSDRKVDCKMTRGFSSCNGCDVVQEVARNLKRYPSSSVTSSIREVTDIVCPVGTEFKYIGNILSLDRESDNVIQLRPIHGKDETNREASQDSTAAI